MIVFKSPCSLQCETAFHGEILDQHSLRQNRFYSLRPTAPVAKVGKLGQASMLYQGTRLFTHHR